MNLQGRDLKIELSGEDVKLLHTELAQLGFTIAAAEQQRAFFGPSTYEAVQRFQVEHHLPVTGVVDAATAKAINQAVDALKTESFVVSGRVFSADRAGVGGLRVQVVDKNPGPDVALAAGVSDASGWYSLQYSVAKVKESGKQSPDIQVRVYAGETMLGASEVRYNAGPKEMLDVLLPATASATLPSEYETLTSVLAAHFKGKLGDLKESDTQQDITYLANKTGWDARAVALAALADQFSQRSGQASIPAVFFYALFRAGLPTNEDTLYHVDPGTLTAIWNKAADQGVIPKSVTSSISQAVSQFQTLSAQKLLTSPSLAGVSSLKDMLAVSGLNESQQQQFSALYVAYRADPPSLWKAVEGALGQDSANRLRLDGKLAFLTINNAPLMQQLHAVGGAAGLSDPLQLAQAGYHRAAKWGPVLNTNIAIPKEIPGDTPEAKRANYAEYLAAQLRLSYPTAAVAEMVRNGDLAIGVPEQVHSFLTENQGKFEIGVQPVQQYIARNKLQVADAVVTEVKRLQRVYQITPNDQAMIVLLKRGIDAAYHVVQYQKDSFVQGFAGDFGGADTALQVYDRSVQVHNAVLNIAVSYLTAKNGIQLGASPLKAAELGSQNGGQILQPAPKGPPVIHVQKAAKTEVSMGDVVAPNAGDVIAYATLEGLFGSMDFCACDHCRSILSPAAYLVDLLLFIDREPTQADKDGNDKVVNPQTVLLERRPDVQHLPLTCENTNTALPYIDLVNETLEYFIGTKNKDQQDKPSLSLKDYLGHDTGGAAAADLLASPRFVIDKAYDTLRGELFPTSLPFHQPLENLRRYFAKFGVPLPLAMERLRKSDALDGDPYGWRDILIEELRLSRAEYGLLTKIKLTLQTIYGFASGTEADAIAELSKAKEFARRVEITYDALIAILGTRFVNPNSDLVPKLERLGVPFAMLAELKAKNDQATDAKFDNILQNQANPPDPAEYGGDIKVWVKDEDNYTRIMGIITLSGSDSCNFDNLEFRYATPVEVGDTSNRLGRVEFVRLLRFIRLWQKLGWTIEQTDAAICALFPVPPFPLGADVVNSLDELDPGFSLLLPRLGIVVRVMRMLNLANGDLLPLLACWSDIGTHGDGALYRQMFLNPTILSRDPVFADNGYGEFLDRDPVKKNNPDNLIDHAETLRSAFNLTGDEFERILSAPALHFLDKTLQFDEKTPLTMANISAVYRWGWLARKLRLSVKELLLLTSLTGLDPFAAPDSPSAANPAILELTGFMQALEATSLKSTEALYLIWNQDLSGKSVPDPAHVTELARTLRGDFTAIDAEFAATEDSNGDIARARMALVYGPEPTDTFFALLDDTLVLDVAYTHSQQALEPAITAADPKIAYDDFLHRLSHTGLVSMAIEDTLDKVPAVSDNFQKAVGDLFHRSEDIKGSFFTRYQELQPLYETYIASNDPPAMKRTALLAGFDPELSRRRKLQQALQRLTAAAGVDLAFTQVLLDPSVPPGGPYPLHAERQTKQPALNEVLALKSQGLDVQFFFRDTADGPVVPVPPAPPIAANLDYLKTGTNPLPANPNQGAISGIWRGFVEAPEAGFYNIVIEADRGAKISLRFDGKDRALTPSGAVRRNTDSLELKAGTLYEIVVTVERVKDALSIKWETPKRPREVIPGRYLYPLTVFGPFSDAYTRFLKVVSLASGLALTANEMAHFATDADYQIAAANGDGWLNVLPVSGDTDTKTAIALLKPFEALLDFARIKAGLAPNDERLLTVLQDPSATLPNGDSLLLVLTGWEGGSLTALLNRFLSKTETDLKPLLPNLTRFNLFRRVFDGFTLTKGMGISGSALIAATTNEPVGATVRNLQAALRARYADADWREVIQPINDAMRGLQRNALVAYILHQFRESPDHDTANIDTADKLFEYFLMDVQVEPCIQTSRIRHALSSVQLFIERCLMNLEPRVSPASIKAEQWVSMKRYRMWEANRKIFLFPENSMEPELRDDKSPFFKEIESELLQSDITDGSATTALLNYLAKLEEVAKLEPCGIYHQEGDPQRNTGDVDHVIARTAGAHRKYYYRSRSELRYWTALEQVNLDIEDNPVIPVIWKGRLLLFWLRIMKKAPDSPQKPRGKGLEDMQLPPNPNVTIQAMLCWSEYYNGKWQPTKTSAPNRPAELGQWPAAGRDGFDRSRLSLDVYKSGDALQVTIAYDIFQLLSFFLFYDTHSLPVRKEDAEIIPPTIPDVSRLLREVNGVFYALYNQSGASSLIREVLNYKAPLQITPPDQPLDKVQNIWDAPFFLEDSRHVFFVTTTETLATVSKNDGFGIFQLSQPAGDIPPLVSQLDPSLPAVPDRNGVVTNGPGFGFVDPSPIERFVSEDAYIHIGIGATGNVRFGAMEIGPAGAQSKQ